MVGMEIQSIFLKQNFFAKNSTYYMSKKTHNENIHVFSSGTLP